MFRLNLIFSILLIGCSSMVVNTDRDLGADLSVLKTYEWAPPPAANSANPADVKNSLLEKRVQKAVEEVLQKKGYETAKSGTPDFKITYDAFKTTETDIRSYDSPYSSGRLETYRYEVGTLFLNILVPSTSTVMWRGWAETEIPENMKPEDREKRIREAVNKILAKFPSKTVPAAK